MANVTKKPEDVSKNVDAVDARADASDVEAKRADVAVMPPSAAEPQHGVVVEQAPEHSDHEMNELVAVLDALRLSTANVVDAWRSGVTYDQTSGPLTEYRLALRRASRFGQGNNVDFEARFISR